MMETLMSIEQLKKKIRDVQDFPKPGILFKDITPLLSDGTALRSVIDHLANRFNGQRIDQIVCVEARGFIFGSALAYRLGCGMTVVRKPGKLPAATIRTTYDLEYGTDTLEMHADAIHAGDRVLIVDDLLATGGTVGGVLRLVAQMGAEIAGLGFLIELKALKGRQALPALPIVSLIEIP
jgi:adenine phosphoribosyltransferase